MKRILHVVSTLAQGGTESVVLNYFSNMNKEEIIFDFLVIWGNSKKEYDDVLKSQGCRIYRMKNPPNRFCEHGKELKKFFDGNEYDIVHIHAMSSLRYRVAKIAKKSGVKTVIYHSHISSCDKNKLLHSLCKRMLNKWCDYRFACSEVAGKFMYNSNFTIIRNAIDLERYAFDDKKRKALRERYGLQDKFVVGNIGRMTTVKNQKFLFPILHLLAKKEDAILFLVGDGSEIDMLKETARQYEVTDRVIFAGNVGTDVCQYYSIFDCLAFPSRFEGLSMVLVEAQANGLPIVASDLLSDEHKISDNFIFLPITESEENYLAWAKSIIGRKNGRCDNMHVLEKAGYDIKNEAKKLQEFYLSL